MASTPKVRQSPEALRITAQNKMRHSKEINFAINFSQCNVRAHAISANKEKNTDNQILLNHFLEEIKKDCQPERNEKEGFISWKNVSGRKVLSLIREFNFPNSLEDLYQFPRENTGLKDSFFSKYVNERINHELSRWNIALPYLKTNKGNQEQEVFGFSLPLRKREKGHLSEDKKIWNITSRRNIRSDGDQTLLLNECEKVKIWEDFEERKRISGAESTYPSDKECLRYRETPLLLLHVIGKIDGEGIAECNFETPVFTMDFYMPKTEVLVEEITYAVNTIGQQFNLFDDDNEINLENE